MPSTRAKLVHVRAILQRRLKARGGRYWHPGKALKGLAWAHTHGISLDELETLARAATSWSLYFDELHRRLGELFEPDAPDPADPPGQEDEDSPGR